VRLTLLALAIGIAAILGAYAFRLFTAGGAVAALAVGAAVLLAGGWGLALTLVGAFASTAVLTRYRRSEKIQPEHRRGRTASQVLANGVVPATVAIAGALFDLSWAVPAAVGAIAATTADTWATEVGLLSRQPPRLITTGAIVPRGRSGGITLLGTLSGAGGAVFAAVLGRFATPTAGASSVLAAAAGGIAGLLIDSVLGATVQVRYRCPACGEEGEVETCPCGAVRQQVGGWRWVTNDTVNVLGTLTGATVGMLLAIAR
jgi:uncharacterized protein (TIGR00297 family)